MDIEAAFRRYLSTPCKAYAGAPDNGMFEVSIDHSVSEQLTGKPDQWHTTVLILSRALEHAELARAIGRHPADPKRTLRKWAGSNRAYKTRFRQQFLELFDGAETLVLAWSARERDITASQQHFVDQLGLSAMVHRCDSVAGKKRVRIGPDQNGAHIELAANQADMMFAILHFLSRMYCCMFSALQSVTGRPACLNWNMTTDKPPNDLNGPYDLALNLLLLANHRGGRVMRMTYHQSDTVETDLLADNLAGLLNEHAEKGLGLDMQLTHANSFYYWEQWVG